MSGDAVAPRLKDRPLVYLIHGTWGRRAPFVRDGSELRETISSELRSRCEGEPEFRAFEWSGWNTLRARVFWADALRKDVEAELAISASGRPVFLVSHSHGGSVAAIAMKNSPIMQERVTGVVAMATPFVEIGPTTFGRGAATFAYFLLMLLLSFLGTVFFIFAQLAISPPTMLPYLLVPLAVTVLHTVDRRLYLVRRLLVRLWRQRKVMNTARFKSRNLLVVSVPWDETGLTLGFSTYMINICQFFARISSYIGFIIPVGSMKSGYYSVIKSLITFIYRYILYIVLTFSISILILFGPSLISDISDIKNAFFAEECAPKPGLDGIASGIVGAACSVVEGIRAATRLVVISMPFMILASVFLLAPIVGGLMYRVVGWFGPLHVVFSRILVTTLPLQGGEFLRLPNRPRRVLTRLRHSEVYLDSATIKKIAVWIANCRDESSLPATRS